MSVNRHGLIMLAILAIAAAPAFASAPASSQTLCNAIGSEISQPPQSGSPPATASATLARAASTEDEGASGSTSGGGGEALVEPRGRWKSLLPGAFK